MENETNNLLLISGKVDTCPVFSHESHGINFFSFSLLSKRLSGTFDRIPVIIREDLIIPELADGEFVSVKSELRSFNKKTDTGNKLIISAFVREVAPAPFGEYENSLELSGTLCKDPVYRKTPLGREICDMMLAINRRYGRSDYLPLIAWGQNARRAAELVAGDEINLLGRLQSREYTKTVDGVETVRTTYEVSVSAFEQMSEKARAYGVYS